MPPETSRNCLHANRDLSEEEFKKQIALQKNLSELNLNKIKQQGLFRKIIALTFINNALTAPLLFYVAAYFLIKNHYQHLENVRKVVGSMFGVSLGTFFLAIIPALMVQHFISRKLDEYVQKDKINEKKAEIIKAKTLCNLPFLTFLPVLEFLTFYALFHHSFGETAAKSLEMAGAMFGLHFGIHVLLLLVLQLPTAKLENSILELDARNCDILSKFPHCNR